MLGQFTYVLGAVTATSSTYQNGSLYDQLWSPTVMGTQEVNKFAFPFAKIIQWLVSWVAVLGLYGVIAKTLLCCAVLSMKGFFKRVHDYQQEVAIEGGYGWGGIGYNKYNDNTLTRMSTKKAGGFGIMAIFSMVFLIIPDLWDLCFPDGQGKGSINPETDSVLNYLTKNAFDIIITMVILGATWKGYIFQIYGQFAEALTLPLKYMANANVTGYLTSRLLQGNNFQFSLNAGGTALDNVRQNTAESIYAKVKSVADLHTDDQLFNSGNYIQQQIKSKLSDNVIVSNAQSTFGSGKITPSDYSGISPHITYGPDATMGPGIVVIPLGPAGASKNNEGNALYAYIRFTCRVPFHLWSYTPSKSFNPNNSSTYVSSGF